MPEKPYELLLKVADILHFLGKYDLAGMIVDLAVICSVKKLETLEEVHTYRNQLERELV